MKLFLELIRIIVIFTFLGGLLWLVLGSIYRINESTEAYSWLGALAIFILLFVFYRNKLQFSGWYTGKGRVKLPKTITAILILTSILFSALPFVFGPLFS